MLFSKLEEKELVLEQSSTVIRKSYYQVQDPALTI